LNKRYDISMIKVYADDQKMKALTLKILRVSPPGTIDVSLKNSSQESIKIWQDSNSWGAARWRVMLARNGHIETLYQNPDQIFSRNVPHYFLVEKGQTVQKTLDVNDGNWRGLSKGKITFKTGDSLTVVYNVPVSDEARKAGVWYGVVSAVAAVP